MIKNNNYNYFIKMQPTSSITDYIEFKNEIMKRIRLLESKFTSELNSKFDSIYSNFENIELRISAISQNNTALIEHITNQNFNFEKYAELIDFQTKAEQELLNHDIKIRNILQIIEKLKLRYVYHISNQRISESKK